MKLNNEAKILNIDYRKKVIEEIQGSENVLKRKEEHYRRHRIYKDLTKLEVLKYLEREKLQPETLALMSNRASNISICRKIIDKLARCYTQGVLRSEDSEQTQSQVEIVEDLICIDTTMKKVDRYRQLHKNACIQIVPILNYSESNKISFINNEYYLQQEPKFKIKLKPLLPYEFDVIEDAYDPEKPIVYILSAYRPHSQQVVRATTLGESGVRHKNVGVNQDSNSTHFSTGDNSDQTIADAPIDQGISENEFVWWSSHFHFTTNEKGEIIKDKSPPDMKNPIEVLPFLDVTEDQDGSYWALGGEDLPDGAVLVNILLTDRFSIANIQGWGQMVITGRNIPETIEGGPHKAIRLVVEPDETVAPSVTYQSGNPPLAELGEMVFQYVALLLSTNNLSVTTISGNLNASDVASGISKLIENSEAMTNIEDKQKLFKDVETKLWKIYAKWNNILLSNNMLDSQSGAVGLIDENIDVKIKFPEPKPVITEDQKLKNLETRKKLGIDTMLDLIMKDDPDLSEEQAQEKLNEILKEKLERAMSFAPQVNKTEKGFTNDGNKESSIRIQSVQNPESEANESGESGS